MDIENEEMDKKEKKLKEEEKNDEESTIDGEINIINKLKDISEKNGFEYDLAF